MNRVCGQVNPENSCRCIHKVKALAGLGMLDPQILRFHRKDGKKIKDVIDRKRLRFEETYYQEFLAQFRNQPFYDAPDMVQWLRGIMKQDDFKN